MQLLLASSSPRRVELLRSAGFVFSTQSPNIDERMRRDESPKNLVMRLAKEKALVCQRPGLTVVAADTTVVSPNGVSILGKPRDKKDALRMLGLLQGKTHRVWTGYCVTDGKKAVVRAVATRVTFRPLTLGERRAYVETGEPMDKAGAYAAQGVGMTLIRKISGSYTNVIGLPVCEVISTLRLFGHVG